MINQAVPSGHPTGRASAAKVAKKTVVEHKGSAVRHCARSGAIGAGDEGVHCTCEVTSGRFESVIVWLHVRSDKSLSSVMSEKDAVSPSLNDRFM